MANLKNYYCESVEDFNNVFSSGLSLKILQWNVRGLNDVNKIDNILQFLDELNTSIDVIVIGETRLNKENTRLFNIRNFSPIFSCRDSSSGGLAVFVHKNLTHKIIENTFDDGLHHIFVEIKINGLCYDVHSVYRPPCLDFNRFHDLMESWLQNSSNNRPCFIIGDINVPVNLFNNNVVLKYRNLVESFGFICTDTFVTRPVSSNILDHFICQFEYAHRVKNYTILNNVSDHLPVVSSFNLGTQKLSSQKQLLITTS